MIKETGGSREIKKGYNQVFLITDTFEILLNEIKKGTGLNNHSHIHKQFVYCFQGYFDLIIEENKYRLVPGDAMIIDSEAGHSAEAPTDFMSVDFKYISDSKETFAFRDNVLIEKLNDGKIKLAEADFDGMKFKKITNTLDSARININVDQKKKYFLVVPKRTSIKVNNAIREFVPMKIYEAADKGGFSLEFLTGDTEVCLFEI